MKEERHSDYKPIILVVSGLVSLTGLAVCIGWLFNIPVLTHVKVSFVTMKFNTAAGFILLGLSIMLQVKRQDGILGFAEKFFSTLVLVLGILSLSEDILDYSLGIDQFFITDTGSLLSGNPHPGRMSALTAACFILMGLASFIVRAKKEVYRAVGQALLHGVTLLSFIVLVGYILNVPAFYKLSFMTSMAIHTALSFFMLSIAAFLLNPSLGIAGLFTSNTIGSISAKKLFYQTVIAILILGFLRIEAHRNSWFSTEFGIALFTCSFIFISFILIWRMSKELDRMNAEKAKAEGNFSKINTFLNATPDPIVVVDANGIIQLVNNQVQTVYGYEREELIGKEIEMLLPPRFRSDQSASANIIFSIPQGSVMELFALRKDGGEFPVEISINPIEASESLYVSVAIRDITHRKESEVKLAGVTNRLTLATQTSRVGIWDYDAVNNILVWDDVMFQLYAAKKETFLGAYEAWRSGLHPDDVERGDREIQWALSGEKEFDTEFRIIWPDHSVHYIKAKALVMRNEKGEATRMIGTNWDITIQKMVELETKESNERNKIFIEQAPNAIAMFDTDMCYMAASKKWMEDYKLTGKDIIGWSHYEIFPEIGDDWKTIHQECLKGASNTCDEAPFQRADGSLQWISWNVCPWYVLEGAIGGLLMYTADITAIKRKDEEAILTKQILDKTNEVARIGTWEVNMITNTVTWSRITKEIHEVPQEYEPELTTAINFFKEGESRDAIQAAVTKAIAQGTPYDIELELVTVKGNIVWVRTIGQVEFIGETCKRLYGVFQDINEIKIAERALSKANEEMKAILNSGPISIIGTDNNGIITHFNSGAEMLLQYSASEMVGHHTPALIHIEQEIMDKGNELSALHGREIQGFNVFVELAYQEKREGFEWTYKRKDGTTFPVQLNLISRKNEVGEDAGFLGVATDITKRKEAEEKLRNYSILEAKSKEMEQFVYIASHDLREPLLTIKNYSDLLIEDFGDTVNESVKRYTKSISKAANRMDELIRSLLDYSRLSKIKTLEKVDANQLVKESLADLNSLVTSSKSIVKIEILPVLMAHPLELKLLFQNLISNAIKFKQKDVLPEINISFQKINHGWKFSVSDNGIGIEASDKEKVFIIFQQLHSKTHYEGTGIGLAHCKKIAELHNGKIWVDSKPGCGSTFYFTILTE